MTQNTGFNIDGFAHGNLENLSHVYPTAFNLGFEGVGFPTYKISDLLRSAFGIAFKPTVSINVLCHFQRANGLAERR